MKQSFDIAKLGLGLLAAGILVTASACSYADGGRAPKSAQPSTSSPAASKSRPTRKTRCGPPHYSPTPHTIHPAVVATGRAGVSPPVRSLPKAKPPPPGSYREIPLHRLPPWSERCPPPATAPAARS